ncbi:MAG: hypothetical protein ACI80I_003595 [Akkermansiaceae bacterium]|jgi:hypothetical protein
MLILTHATVRNPAILKVRQLPRKFFGRVTVWPKGRIGGARALRIVAEFQFVRYALALLPLIVVALVWNRTALIMSQAPLLMLALIWWVEMRLLRVSPKRRAKLIDQVEAERGLDLLRVQARGVLTRIAAARGLRKGQLHLVIEQSDLGAIAPLTYVSVQSEEGPEVISLTFDEQRVLWDGLFQAPMNERLLQRINLSQGVFLRDISLDAGGVSAHARLSAALA